MKRLPTFLLTFGLLVLGSFIAGTGCSSDPDTPLGEAFLQDSLIRSQPGNVFQDTIPIAVGDTSFVTNALITYATTMTIGRIAGFEKTMLLRFNFSPRGDDTLKTVSSAVLNLRVTTSTQTDTLQAAFYELLSTFEESDTMTVLKTAAAPIPDSTGVNTQRSLQYFPSRYTLSNALVQAWIRGTTTHYGMAIVLEDTTTTKQLVYGTHEALSSLRPFLRVTFTDQTEKNYNVAADGMLVKPLTTTSNLLLSDGYTRRIYLPVDLSTFKPDVLLHDARLVLNVVPDSWTGGDVAVTLYAPKSSDISSADVLSGTTVATTFVDITAGTLSLPIRTIISTFLGDPTTNHGFVLRYAVEGTSVRQMEFYASAAADSVKPILEFTFSGAPQFKKK
jgi:hypothetical protein